MNKIISKPKNDRTNNSRIRRTMPRWLIWALAGGLVLLACNIPGVANAPTPVITDTPTPVPAGVFTFTPTSAAVVFTDTPTLVPSPVSSFTPTTVPGIQVQTDTLCWEGPGGAYNVVSSLHSGQRVTLLGRGSIPGWYIVDNPTYHNPCWVQDTALQIQPGFDSSGLKIFDPPATVVPSEVPTRVPKPTKVPTAVPTV
jgi:hypothetical protein